jgi:tetratricopeptide (TPR) repeat protein
LDQPREKGIHLKSGALKGNLPLLGFAFLLTLFAAQAVLTERLGHWVRPESLEASQTLRMDKRVASTLRALGFLSGYKVLVGHAFWIKVIQYYGDAENSLDRYSKLYDYCSLASDLNPKFVSIYTLGAAALAFHLKRMDEAARLLQKGINSNPKDVRLKLMYASIAYQNTQEFEKVIPFLEAQIYRGDAPYMMVNILANTYEKVGRYGDSIKVWQKIMRDADADDVRIQAAQKLQTLYRITRGSKNQTAIIQDESVKENR